MEVLSVANLHKHFGGLKAVNDVSLRVEAGERRAVIGPNGAGKTTLFGLISGEIQPTSGRVVLFGQDVTRLRPHQLARLGLARTFQKNNLFLGLSVLDNVRIAVQARRGAARPFVSADDLEDVNQAAADLLRRLGLWEQRHRAARALSYGEQRQLEIAIALACEPRLLLLDEPTAGLSPAETAEMVRLLQQLPADLTILIIEHDMDVVSALAGRVTVLHYGQVLAEGTFKEVQADQRVLGAYLGSISEVA